MIGSPPFDRFAHDAISQFQASPDACAQQKNVIQKILYAFLSAVRTAHFRIMLMVPVNHRELADFESHPPDHW